MSDEVLYCKRCGGALSFEEIFKERCCKFCGYDGYVVNAPRLRSIKK